MTNESGFTALPSGYRYASGEFFFKGYMERWWSTTKYDYYDVKIRILSKHRKYDLEYEAWKSFGIPVRCVKD